MQRSNDDGTKKGKKKKKRVRDQKRPGGSCSEADSSSSFGWLVAWLAGSAGSGSSSGSSSNSQNSQTGASPSSPAAVYIGNNHAASPMVSSRRYDSSNNGLYSTLHSNCGYLLWSPSILLLLLLLPVLLPFFWFLSFFIFLFLFLFFLSSWLLSLQQQRHTVNGIFYIYFIKGNISYL